MADVLEVPLHGHGSAASRIPVVDTLSDAELEELNSILPWKAFVADANGRRFGRPASATKRPSPSPVPDERIVRLHEILDLSRLTVLEIGCFEGIHTTALAQFARHVKACDSRIVNLVKTAVRCAMYQVCPTLFLWDVEKPLPAGQDPSCDILHHVGVLYHLLDPVAHLRLIAPHVRRGIMLDTHFARPDQATQSYSSGANTYRYQKYTEGGLADPFSGMNPSARWLLLSDIIELLNELGFPKTQVTEREERNGPRCLIIAQR